MIQYNGSTFQAAGIATEKAHCCLIEIHT